MAGELSNMSREELWTLFPIELVAPREAWVAQYERFATRLLPILSKADIRRMSHVGSTAIPSIWAKDIVDVLVEVGGDSEVEDVARLLEEAGLTRMSEDTGRVSLNLGYTPAGFADEVFHVHVREAGDNDELYFRDYLCDHADVARAYERLKKELWHTFEHDRDAYTDAKGPFIRRWTAIAKEAFAGRY